jgi:6-phosphogluconolactonase
VAEPLAAARRSPGTMADDATDFWIGTYARPGGRGLYPLSLAADGELAPRGDPAAPANASFGAYWAARGIHYLVDECDSLIGAWRLRGGAWQRLATVPAHGKEPCYLALDEAGGRLAVANYASGSLALFALGEDGLPTAAPAIFQDAGSGPVARRQQGPHVHCVRFSSAGDALYAVDLGADHVLRLPLDGARLGRGTIAYAAPPGSGPRHLLFHPARPFALLLSELASTLTLLEAGPRALRPLATCSTLPEGWRGENLGGHLAWPRGGLAYVSNRGHDSVVPIEVDLTRGMLAPRRHVASGGRSPRHFRRLGGHLVVAHEKDGAVSSLRLGDDGGLAPTGHVLRIPGAGFVLPVEGKFADPATVRSPPRPTRAEW